MAADDPDRPALHTLSKWEHLRGCGACRLAKSKKPPQEASHPRAGPTVFAPGECLYVDGMGPHDEETLDGLDTEPTIDGTSTSFIIVDASSNAITIVPVLLKDNATFMRVMEDYQTSSGIKIKKIRSDGAYVNKTTLAWASPLTIELTGCAPRTQQQTGPAENGVRIIKDGSRAASMAAVSYTHLTLPFRPRSWISCQRKHVRGGLARCRF